ncbi:MAG TPA: acyloxyacyl hydrolase [Verrucomicrobiota bacterium]|mgnify:FL=1|nr:acyloxyacyl hydrolase [Verrucomicrobiota bacterium]HRZ38133.1 acyloxyacyl hydrolase [Candidatus Paceibacterota bacterium]HRZ55034.1 acyloxyacyl hydrolase [Candidatus Paceibacterota bacterium]
MCKHHGIGLWRSSLFLLFLLVLSESVVRARVRADEGVWESVGARCGISSHSSANRFIQTELWAAWNVAPSQDLGRSWSLRFQFDSSAGWLSGRGADSFVGAVGPVLEIGRERLPVSLRGGISPTLLSRDSFGNKDFGILFQLTSHLGVEIHVLPHVDIGYRFQHMSNAGLCLHNPGLNLHMFSLSYAF